jgi:hypothetical protein
LPENGAVEADGDKDGEDDRQPQLNVRVDTAAPGFVLSKAIFLYKISEVKK